jgi:hypothetical protein
MELITRFNALPDWLQLLCLIPPLFMLWGVYYIAQCSVGAIKLRNQAKRERMRAAESFEAWFHRLGDK